MKQKLNLRNLVRNFVCAAFIVPTTNLDGWQPEKFSSGKQNQIEASTKGVLIKVAQSASPLIYPLKAKLELKGFHVRGEFAGLPAFSDIHQQGQKGHDDFPLRIGFVIPGDRKLNGVKRLFAAEWVKRLYALAPPGSGIDQVRFFNLSQNPGLVGTHRLHPSSELIREDFFALVVKSGPFDHSVNFPSPVVASAIWISVDGDDTKSAYEVLISQLELFTSGESN